MRRVTGAKTPGQAEARGGWAWGWAWGWLAGRGRLKVGWPRNYKVAPRPPAFFLHLTLCHLRARPANSIANMSWRNQGITGSNNIPLGNRRRFGGDTTPSAEDKDGYDPSAPATGLSDLKRGRSPVRGKCPLCCAVSWNMCADASQNSTPTVPGSARSAIAGAMPRTTRPPVLWVLPPPSPPI